MNFPSIVPRRDPLLSTAAVARWLGVSARTVCFWAECGEIPAIKVGRQWRFREEEVKRWMENGAQTRVAPLWSAKTGLQH